MFLFCLVFAIICARLFICASWSKNVTNDFRINFRYAFVHAKTTLSFEYQKM